MMIGMEVLEDYYRRLSNWGRWGPGDERGALNHVTPDRTRRAAALVRRGAVFSLQLPLDGRGPQTGAFGRINPVHQMVATGTDHVSGGQDYNLGFGFADDSLFLFLQGGRAENCSRFCERT